MEDLLKILNQSVRNKTSSNEPKVEAEYYDEDFYYDDDSKASNAKNGNNDSDNDKVKTDKKLSVESDYQYQGRLYYKNRFWCFRDIRFDPVQV